LDVADHVTFLTNHVTLIFESRLYVDCHCRCTSRTWISSTDIYNFI